MIYQNGKEVKVIKSNKIILKEVFGSISLKQLLIELLKLKSI